jgi:DNA-binding transcriptional LysR family regulator
MRTLDLPSLELFVAAVEECSLTQAAARENLVASAASKRIALLEARVGTRLLERCGRGVKPTPAGLMLLQRARSILRGVSVAEDALAAYNSEGNAPIRIVANSSTISQRLPRRMGEFLRQHRGIRVEMSEAASKGIPALVSRGEADFGIYHAPWPHPGVVSVHCGSDRIGVVVPRGHALDRGEAVRFEDTLGYDYVGFPEHTLEAFVSRAGHSISRPPQVAVTVANLEARCRMVREGAGIALLSEDVARAFLRTFNLSLVPLADAWAVRQFFLCVRDADLLHGPRRQLFDSLRAGLYASASRSAEIQCGDENEGVPNFHERMGASFLASVA